MGAQLGLKMSEVGAAMSDLLGGVPGESTSVVAARVDAARRAAMARGVRCNAELPAAELRACCPLSPARKLHSKNRMRKVRAMLRKYSC